MTSFIPRRNDEYQIENIDGETMLYHAGKTDTLYLNESATIVWYLCDGERSEQDIVNLLKENYPDSISPIEDGVREALQSFTDFGGIEKD